MGIPGWIQKQQAARPRCSRAAPAQPLPSPTDPPTWVELPATQVARGAGPRPQTLKHSIGEQAALRQVQLPQVGALRRGSKCRQDVSDTAAVSSCCRFTEQHPAQAQLTKGWGIAAEEQHSSEQAGVAANQHGNYVHW